jgi:bifunctional non-homologous end joining protein LigD
MHPVLGPLPADSERYRYEVKWDGFRALVEVRHGELVGLWSRRGRNMVADYPSLRHLPAVLRRASLVLDAELVGMDEHGRPRFQRMQLGDNLVLLLFDVLQVNDDLVIGEEYDARRRRLEQFEIRDGRWRTVDVFDDGAALVEATQRQGLEGVLAKRRDSKYECGRRSSSWIKYKHRARGVFAVGGWMPQTSDARRIGSLLIGELDERGRLVFRGGVSGFDENEHAAMVTAFVDARTDRNPFAVGKPPRAARFLTPTLLVEVSYQELTSDGQLRHPTFEGFRFER